MKISVIMQTYLGDYPGSRSEPERKFIRAIECFLAQTYEDKELVIVADGCKKAFDIFHEKYSDNKYIKFCYINKGPNRMYETVGGERFYRGTPKKIGVAMSTGELITYYDSDDIILPNRLENIANHWKNLDGRFTWSANSCRWMAEVKWDRDSCSKVENAKLDLTNYGIDKAFELASSRNNVFVTSSWAITHRRGLNVEWRDCLGVWEDYDFVKRLQNTGEVSLYHCPSYVLCHYTDLWDY